MPTRTTANQSAELKRLRQENKDLRAKLASQKKPPRHFPWRTIGLVLCSAIAAVLLVTGSLLLWLGRTAVDTNSYMASVGPMIEQPAVQTALADKATIAIFEQVNVEQIATEALPPRADFLAAPLATQVENYTNETLKKITATERFQQAWLEVHRRSHQRLIEVLGSDKAASGVIDINALYASMNDRLAESKLSFLANRELPPRLGDITVVQSEWVGEANFLINNIGWLRMVTILGFVIFTALAIYLARNRRRTITRLFTAYALLMIGLVIAIRIARMFAEREVQAAYVDAFTVAWRTFLTPFYIQVGLTILLALAVAFGAWIGGSSKMARKTRARLDDVFAGRIHESLFGNSSSSLLRWFATYRRWLNGLIVGGAILFLLFAPLTAARLFWTIIVVLLLIGIVSILGGRPVTAAQKA